MPPRFAAMRSYRPFHRVRAMRGRGYFSVIDTPNVEDCCNQETTSVHQRYKMAANSRGSFSLLIQVLVCANTFIAQSSAQ